MTQSFKKSWSANPTTTDTIPTPAAIEETLIPLICMIKITRIKPKIYFTKLNVSCQAVEEKLAFSLFFACLITIFFKFVHTMTLITISKILR